MYSDELQKQKQVEIDLHPIKKWKRVLLYLGDMMSTFILGVLLLNIIVMPIASRITSTSSKEAIAAEDARNDILYEHELLFYKDETPAYKQYNFDGNLKYTFNRFLAYYVFDEGEPTLDDRYPEYVHQANNEVIWTYFNNIRHDEAKYYDIFENNNKQYKHFEISGSSIVLKQEVRDELRVHYKPKESMGSKGQTYFEQLNDLFAALYGSVIGDIKVNDLAGSDGKTFMYYQNIITRVSNSYYTTVAITTGISFVIAWAITKLLIPLVNKSGHTITASIMKIDRLGMNNLMPLSKSEIALSSVFSLVSELPIIAFIPLSYISLIYIFKIPFIPILAIATALLVIISLFIILFSGFNRSGIDMLSKTVCVSSEEVDGIIKAKETLMEQEIAEKRKATNG